MFWLILLTLFFRVSRVDEAFVGLELVPATFWHIHTSKASTNSSEFKRDLVRTQERNQTAANAHMLVDDFGANSQTFVVRYACYAH